MAKNNYKHGGNGTKLYYVWCTMKSRCMNKNSIDYKNYGGRGITICPEWTENFIVFRDWALNNGYAKGLQINRIENNGNYEPNNCNWVTQKENLRNKRNNKLTLQKVNEIRKLHKTENYSYKELSEKYNTTSKYIYKIINNKIWKI